MVWRAEQVIAVAGALAVFVGTVFQIGYFSKFGMEFLSTSSFRDWFFYVGVAGFLLLPFYFIIGERISRLQERKERIGRKRAELENNLLTLAAIIVGFGLAFHALLTQEWRYLDLFLWLFFSVRAVLATAVLLKEIDAGNEIKLRTLTPALAFLALSAFGMGRGYAGGTAGSECVLSFKDGRTLTATYMRSVSDGHLVQLGNDRYYYPKSEVTEIKCDKRKMID